MSSQRSLQTRSPRFVYDLSVNERISKIIKVSRVIYLPGLATSLVLYSYASLVDHAQFTVLTPLKVLWLLGLILLASTLVSTLYNLEDWVRVEKDPRREKSKVIFQITTKGTNVDAVRRGVDSVLAWAGKHLEDFEVWVVTDEGADLDSLASEKVRVIYTPKDYRTRNRTKYKARALNYACELRKGLGLNRSDVWVYFMDEESVVGEDTVLGIKDFIAKKKAEIGHGLIVYPNFWGKNLLVSLADSMRPSQDLFYSALETKLGKVSWLHGSHLLMRADVESKICWDFGVTWGEDSEFGLRASEMGFRIGWLGGVLYEQSPFSITDYYKQRRRWFFHSYNMVFRRLPAWAKATYLVSVIGWLSGLPSFAVSVLNLVFPSSNPFPFFGFVSVAMLYNLVFWYAVGFALNVEPLNLKVKEKVKLAALAAVLFPAYTFLESLAPWYALISYRNREKVGFEVVKK